jgi:hypothetical protein
MKRTVLLFAALVVLGTSSAVAQAATLSWIQPTDPLATVQTYVYTLVVNGGAPVTLVATCVQPIATTPVSCTAPVAAVPIGADTLVLTVTGALGSAAATLSGTKPGVPTGLKVQ